LPQEVQTGIRSIGLRNSHLLAIAPAGTISLLANNVSSGIEPIFGLNYKRCIRGLGEEPGEYQLQNYAARLWPSINGGQPMPRLFEDALDISPSAQLAMQAVLQPFVDNAISKTISLNQEPNVNEVSVLYERAHARGLKGCTIFRPRSSRGDVLYGSRAAINNGDGDK